MASKKPLVSIVVSIGDGRLHNHVIGRKDKLLWPIPDDLRRFKELTMGHPVIMGRKTFESIVAMLGKPLPGRTNIVITRSPADYMDNPEYEFEHVLLAGSLEDALAIAEEIDKEEIFIGGGAQIYEQALPFVDRLYLTLVDADEEGDAYFPAYEHLFTKKISEESREHNGLKYKWVTLEK